MANAPTNPAAPAPPGDVSAPPVVEDLADRVDQLLSNISEASDRLDKTLNEVEGSAAPSSAAPGAQPAAATPPPPTSSEPKETSTAPKASPAPAPGEPTLSLESGVPEIEDLLAQVDMLLRDAASAPAASAATPEAASKPIAMPEKVPPAKPEEIKSLDDQLARLTDNLLDQAGGAVPSDAEGKAKYARVIMEHVEGPAASSVPAPPPKAEERATTPPVAPEPAPIQTKQVSAPAAPSVAPKPADAHAPIPARERAAIQFAEPEPKGPSLWSRIEPVILRVLGMIAAPLKGKPETLKQTMGWAGVTTLFTSAILWGVVAFRPPPKPVEAEHAFDFVHGDAPGVAHEEEPAAAAGDEAGGEHGAAPKSDGHGGAKSKPADKKGSSKSKPKGKNAKGKAPAKPAEAKGGGGH